jgi:hypothetical protein
MKMEIVRSIHFYQTTWRHIPEDCVLYSHRSKNLKSNTNVVTFMPTLCWNMSVVRDIRVFYISDGIEVGSTAVFR